MEDAREVHVEHGLPVIGRELGDGAVAEDGGVVDQEVQPAAPRLHRLHHRADGVGVGDIRGEHVGAVGAQRVQLGGQRLGIRARRPEVGVVQHDHRAGGVEGARHLRADALRRAGDESDLVSEVNGDGHAVPG